MLKSKNNYKLIKLSIPVLFAIGFVFSLGSFIGTIVTADKKNDLLEKYNTNPKIVANIAAQEQEALNDYQNKIISAEEFKDKIEEIKSEDNLFKTAESIYGQEVKEKNDSLNKQQGFALVFNLSGMLVAGEAVVLSCSKRKLQKEAVEEDIILD